MNPRSILLPLLAVVAASLGFAASSAAQPPDPVTVSAKASRTTVSPGDQLAIAVVMEFEPDWHAHTNAPKPPAGIDPGDLHPTTIAVDGGGLSIWPVQWPKPTMVQQAVPGTSRKAPYGVFAGRAVAYVPVQVPASAAPGSTLALTVKVHYQTCNESTCLPDDDKDIAIELPVVAPPSTAANGADFAAFDPSVFAQSPTGNAPQTVSAASAKSAAIAFQVFGLKFSIDPRGPAGLILLLLVAALGGLLMNFTPCVLPVIPIKIMGLSHAAGNPGRCLYLGTVMSLGIVAFWIALGGAIAFVSGFTAISSLFRTPVFSLAVGLFILVMASGMLGAFAVRLPQAVYLINPSHETAGGSFVFGIMTAVLSTPCTAPFMGSAAAWAATQNPLITLTTFGAIGAGMALPYLVLSASPRLVDWMPRTGPASELVKQVMGILMVGVAVFFLGLGASALIPGGPAWARLSYWWLIGLLAIGASVWLVVRTFQITRSGGRRTIFSFAAAAFALVSGVVAYHFALPSGEIPWQTYSHQLLANRIGEHKVVVMDFTADWCLNCKTIEAAVLERPEVIKALNAPDVAPIKVDLTARQAEGWVKLKDLNEVGIPLLVVTVSPDPVFKSNAYTPDQVLDAINNARRLLPPPAAPPVAAR